MASQKSWFEFVTLLYWVNILRLTQQFLQGNDPLRHLLYEKKPPLMQVIIVGNDHIIFSIFRNCVSPPSRASPAGWKPSHQQPPPLPPRISSPPNSNGTSNGSSRYYWPHSIVYFDTIEFSSTFFQ